MHLSAKQNFWENERCIDLDGQVICEQSFSWVALFGLSLKMCIKSHLICQTVAPYVSQKEEQNL